MNFRFTKKANQLRELCIYELNERHYFSAEKVSDSFKNFKGFKLEFNEKSMYYDGIIKTDDTWQLIKDDYFYDINDIPLEEFCEMIDYIIEYYPDC